MVQGAIGLWLILGAVVVVFLTTIVNKVNRPSLVFIVKFHKFSFLYLLKNFMYSFKINPFVDRTKTVIPASLVCASCTWMVDSDIDILTTFYDNLYVIKTS